MNDQLAESLLSKVMNWEPPDFNRIGVPLQAMAWYKYDEYQQFSPGMRFTESLARWLSQFTTEERPLAIEFIRRRLVYVSTAEMNHLVSIAYLDYIRPILLDLAAVQMGINRWKKAKIAESQVFKLLERRTLFLGLSDGARTDVFRRANPKLSNEQVRLSHEISPERVKGLLEDLSTDLVKMGALASDKADQTQVDRAFEVVVLLDDFSASGISYLGNAENGKTAGKIGKFLERLSSPENPLSKLTVKGNCEVIFVLYLATAKVEARLKKERESLEKEFGIKIKVVVVQCLPDEIVVSHGKEPQVDALVEKYYDDHNETDSTRLGGTDLKYGFAGCGLPLILSHNTPNNSIGLLWADGPQMRSLFPRVTRHKD